MAEILTQKQWQAPDKLRIKREAGMAYRYIRKSDVERRLDEGWEIVNSPLKEKSEGGPMDKAQHYRGLILMRMPQHMADQRNQYYLDKHNRRVRAVARGGGMPSIDKAATKDGNNRGGDLAGAIGKGLTIVSGSISTEGVSSSQSEHIPVAVHPDDLLEDKQVLAEVREKKESSESTPKNHKKQKRR